MGAFLWLGAGWQGRAEQATISGPATAIDGDGLRIGGASIRLWGIDAPEMDQTCIAQTGEHYACGVVARDALARLIAGQIVLCRILGIDRYNRALGECFTANTTDTQSINSRLVQIGMAVAFERYSRAYIAEAGGGEARQTRVVVGLVRIAGLASGEDACRPLICQWRA